LTVVAGLTPIVPLPVGLEPLRPILVPALGVLALAALAGAWQQYRNVWVRGCALAVISLSLLIPPAMAHHHIDATRGEIVVSPASALNYEAHTDALEEAASAAPPLSAERLALRQEILDRRAKSLSDALTRIVRRPIVAWESVYVLSPDRNHLLPLKGFGFETYPLDAQDSIAACTIRLRAIAFWSNLGGREHIRVWSLDGRELGQYDKQTRKLHLDGDSTCAFDAVSGKDPKNQLVCVPTVPDDALPHTLDTGALCISIDAGLLLLDDPTLHPYLINAARNFRPYSDLEALAEANASGGVIVQKQTTRTENSRPASRVMRASDGRGARPRQQRETDDASQETCRLAQLPDTTTC
jgi:hypothetical protein